MNIHEQLVFESSNLGYIVYNILNIMEHFPSE